MDQTAGIWPASNTAGSCRATKMRWAPQFLDSPPGDLCPPGGSWGAGNLGNMSSTYFVTLSDLNSPPGKGDCVETAATDWSPGQLSLQGASVHNWDHLSNELFLQPLSKRQSFGSGLCLFSWGPVGLVCHKSLIRG